MALRYISFIRAVLANLGYLMMFVSASFVLTIIAWNSYPFQPHQLVDLIFTALLVVLFAVAIWVFAQMSRDPLVSRITRTKPNELGWEFYVRIASFGVIPFFTWLAYQFPEVGGLIYRILQPGLNLNR
jgi:hypothetical protein